MPGTASLLSLRRLFEADLNSFSLILYLKVATLDFEFFELDDTKLFALILLMKNNITVSPFDQIGSENRISLCRLLRVGSLR